MSSFRFFGSTQQNYSTDVYDMDELDLNLILSSESHATAKLTDELDILPSPSKFLPPYESSLTEHAAEFSDAHNSTPFYQQTEDESIVAVDIDDTLASVVLRLSALQQLTHDVVSQLQHKTYVASLSCITEMNNRSWHPIHHSHFQDWGEQHSFSDNECTLSDSQQWCRGKPRVSSFTGDIKRCDLTRPSLPP